MPASAWLAHVKKTYAAGKSKGMSFRQAMVAAKKTYRKTAAAPKKRRRKKKNVKFEDEGGAIVNPKIKKKKKDLKVEDALQTQASQMGGAIRKPILKKKKKDEKVQEALNVQAAKMGGGMFHSPTHKYLHEKLSGRGGAFDTPFVRKKMQQLMTRHHPALYQTYSTGRVNHLRDEWHDRWHPDPKPQPREKRPTFVDMGGSLRSVSHSENGLLQSFDSTFHHHLELI